MFVDITGANKMKKLPQVSILFAFILLISFGCNRVDDIDLHYEEIGQGETIIFVHGSQEDFRVFLPQINTLGKEFHVITYSRRYNYPNSIEYRKKDAFSPFTEAADLLSLVNKLKIEKLHLVGHSYGGLIAMVFAQINPNKVKSLTLSEPPLLRISGCEEWYQAAQEGLIKKVGAAFTTNDSTLIMKAIFEFFAGADIQNQLPPEILQMLKANLTEMEALVNSENPFPDLKTEFKMPVMLLTTGRTMPMLNCTNEALKKRMPDALHIHIADASHEMWMTHSEKLSQYLRGFVTGEIDKTFLNTETKSIN